MKKVIHKSFFKRGTAILLALVCLISAICLVPINAASREVTITFDYAYDTGGNIIGFVQYTEHDGYVVGTAGEELCTIQADGDDAYCIEPGHSLYSGNTLTTDASAAWNALSKAQKKAVNLALLFGKSGNGADLGGTEGQKWIATQLVVWEFCTGCRDASTFKLKNSKFIDGITAGDNNPGVKSNYNKIIAKLNDYNVIPSFAYETQANAKSNVKEMKYSDGKYTLTLTDSNGMLSDYAFKKTGDVSVSISGNKITLTSSKAIDSPVVFGAEKKMPKVTGTLIACGASTKQDVVTGVQSDTETKSAYFAVKTSSGSLKLIKTSDDGKVSGISFTITGPNNYSKTAKTNADGEFQLNDLVPGTYTVTEVTEDRYETQKAQKVTVESGKVASVKFSNVLKRGDLQVVKSSEDNFNEGVKFHLYGTSLSGAKVDEYAVTDNTGTANFKNILVSGDTPYTLEEVDTAIRYVVPKSQTAPVVWDKDTKREFTNTLKKFIVEVAKVDSETKQPQGDASLAGAKYGIYDGDKLIDTYTTDKDGKFTTKEYVCGDNWTIREIEPSEGYLLNDTVYNVGAEPKNYTIEHNPISIGVTEDVIKGDIEIVKHTDQGQTKIETPEEGATFQLWLKSAGSFDNAHESVRDTLVCDEKGYAKSKKLPYGTYTVHQTYGWEGRHYVDDFDVFVCDNSKPYSFIINNDIFESYLKVVNSILILEETRMNSKAKYPDFFDQRCIVWTNINLFNGFDYEALRGHCCVCQDTQIVRALKLNNDALDEILEIMDVEVEQPIISIDMHYDADDEAMSDCYIFPYCNLNGCFCFSGDGIKEWYIDEKDDLRSFEVTDIDSCFSLFRMLKPSLSPRDVQHFKEEIIAGNINWDMVEKYTDPIGEKVATAMFGDVNDEDSNNE